jgi:[ribulose-bisphosphate carboxylase]-lysine N-methyltransferase
MRLELDWIVAALTVVVSGVSGFSTTTTKPIFGSRRSVALRETASSAVSLETVSANLEQALDACRSDVAKVCKVQVGVTEENRLGLIATTPINKGDVMLAVPYDDRFIFTPDLARNEVYKDILPAGYDGWTGDAGWIALLILNEVARAVDSKGVNKPQRTEPLQDFIQAWVSSLPSPFEMTTLHPYLWLEEDQEILQSSSTNKIYRALDDLDEDATWLMERIWSKDRSAFPERATWNGQQIPCFSSDGYKWAMALSLSRTVFVGGTLQLLPIIDICNHDDKAQEVTGGTMGTFGTTKGAQLIASVKYETGQEVYCSYGPKSAADYLLEHGFCPPQVFKTALSELTFELDSQDRFYDDKLDILEFETFDLAPMNPVQSFDIVSQAGRDGAPDPSMMQFVRLCTLGSTDAFLLESIFRKEVWDFMALPVSEQNELVVVNTIIDACEKALEDLRQCGQGGPEVCHQIRESEMRALTRTMEYLQREKEALDLKEYYQERRLKDLGLDSEWSPEGDDIGFGKQRVPGGADYDW